MAEVEILRVVRAPLNPHLFRGASIDLPTVGERHNHYAFVVAGWILHRDTDALDVEVSCEGRPLARWPASNERCDVAASFPEAPVNVFCGFQGVVRTVDLPLRFELRLDVVGAINRVHLGTIQGQRTPLVAAPAPGLRPALIVTLGRTGSTRLMQLLGQHPQALVHPPFPFETRILGYWASVFDGLASPKSYLQALARGDAQRYWWVGSTGLPAETYIDQDAVAQSLGGASLESLAAFARGRVESSYRISADLAGKSGTAACFVEKQLPHAGIQTIEAGLFPERREIYLVRDWRDMLASIEALNVKRRSTSFGRDVHDNEAEYLAAQAQAVRDLLRAWQQAGQDALLVRYEDLVTRPRRVVTNILRFLDIDASRSTIANMIVGAGRADIAAQHAHRTTIHARNSIGRWKRDLPRATAEQARVAFAEALEAWGYER